MFVPGGTMNIDQKVLENLSKMIRKNSSIDSTHLRLKVSEGNAVLEGSVPKWEMKCLLEDIVAHHPAVRIIRNFLTVQ